MVVFLRLSPYQYISRLKIGRLYGMPIILPNLPHINWHQVHDCMQTADFKAKRQIIDLLDVRGTLSIEDNEKVVYVTCKLGQQRRSLTPISPLSNIGATETTTYACRPTGRYP